MDGAGRSLNVELHTDSLLDVCRFLPGATVLSLRLVSPQWRASVNSYALRERRWALARLTREPLSLPGPPLPAWTPANCALPGDPSAVDLVAAVTRLSAEPWPQPDAAWERQALDSLAALVAERDGELTVAQLSHLPRALPVLAQLPRLSDWASPALGKPTLSFWASAAALMLTARGGAEARCIAHWLHHGLPSTSAELSVAADECCHALSMLFSSDIWSGCPALLGLAADWRSVSMPALDAATPPPARGLTPEQAAVVSWARQLGKRVDGVPGRSAKVVAFAGTGKSATLGAIAGVLQPGMRVLYITYNVAMAKAAKLLPAFIEANNNGVVVDTSTVHALAHTHVIKVSTAMQQKFDQVEDKGLSNRDVLQRLSEEGWSGKMVHMASAMRACTRFQRSGDDQLGEQHIQSAVPELPALATTLLARMEDPNDTFPITHDGYLSLYARSQPLAWADYDLLLVDEAQDLSAVAFRVLERARLERGCAVVLTGDSHQHLYGFAGAINGLDELTTDATFRLTRTFRFGATLAAAADKLLALKGGRVPLRGARGVDTRVTRAVAESVDLDRRDHVVLVRMNASWFRLAVKAVDDGHRIHVDGMEKTLAELERLAIQAPNAQAPAVPLDDASTASLKRLVEWLTPARVLSDIARLRANCVPKADATARFATVHQAKGLQFNSCELAPDVWHSLERELENDQHGHDALHICYTALTRATRSAALPFELNHTLDEVPALVTNGPCGRCHQPFACGVAMPGIWRSAADGNHTRWFCVTCARLLENELQAKPLVALAERLQAQGPAQVAAPAA